MSIQKVDIFQYFCNLANFWVLQLFLTDFDYLTFVTIPLHLGLSKSSINEISSLPTEISSLVKLYQVYQNVYPSRRNGGVTKQYTLGRWLKVYYAYKFAAHLFDQNMFYSQMAHFAQKRVLSTSSSS